MSDQPKTLVVVATYNERENLPDLVESIFEHAPQVDLLVVDDNSPDGTGNWVDEKAKTTPQLRCLHRAGKLGLGTAVIAGMKHAIEGGYQYIINLDGDFSHHPKHLPAMMAMAEGELPIDVVVGSRYVAGGGIEGWPFRRHVMSRCVNLLARTLLWLPVKDASGAFRCYRVANLAELDLDGFRAKGYAFLEEVLWRLKRRGARMAETPIVFADRTRGQSKINMKEAFAALWVMFSLGLTAPFTKR